MRRIKKTRRKTWTNLRVYFRHSAYEYVPDSEIATASQSLDTTMESIHTASLSYSEELDTDADFSIEIPDLPMDEPLSTSELAKLSTKQKPPTGEINKRVAKWHHQITYEEVWVIVHISFVWESEWNLDSEFIIYLIYRETTTTRFWAPPGPATAAKNWKAFRQAKEKAGLSYRNTHTTRARISTQGNW